jgi:hypothetical protein
MIKYKVKIFNIKINKLMSLNGSRKIKRHSHSLNLLLKIDLLFYN